MISKSEKGSSGRLEWVDIAKSVAIILMIVGHVILPESRTRLLIFSFHMPLFFILTGFTMRPAASGQQAWKATLRDLKNIYVPILVALAIEIAGNVFLLQLSFGDVLKDTAFRLFWADAYQPNQPYLGALWFLVVLFWAKLLLRLLDCIFKPSDLPVVYLFFAFIGLYLGQTHQWPQSWDVVPMALFFIGTGRYIREEAHLAVLQKYQNVICFFCFLLWSFCVYQGIAIEVGVQWYPWAMVCVVEAIAGSLCVFYGAQVLERAKWITPITQLLSAIGRNTLIILCVHNLDGFAMPMIASKFSFLPLWLLRVVFDIGVAAMVAWVLKVVPTQLRRHDKAQGSRPVVRG